MKLAYAKHKKEHKGLKNFERVYYPNKKDYSKQ